MSLIGMPTPCRQSGQSDEAASVRCRRQALRMIIPLRTTSSAEVEHRGCDLLGGAGVRMDGKASDKSLSLLLRESRSEPFCVLNPPRRPFAAWRARLVSTALTSATAKLAVQTCCYTRQDPWSSAGRRRIRGSLPPTASVTTGAQSTVLLLIIPWLLCQHLVGRRDATC